MKKLISSILISFILIINLILPISAFAETNWQYKIMPIQELRSKFPTPTDCEADKTKYLQTLGSSVTAGNCEPYILPTSSNDPILINNKNVQDSAIPVAAKMGDSNYKNVYKMLAPIPGISCMDPKGETAGCIGNNVGVYLNIIFKLAIGIAAALAVIMLIINGVTYMGDESVFGKTEAKSKMYSAILGLLIALGAWALLNTISPALTGKGAVDISTASVEIVRDRASDPNFVNNISKIDTSNITPSSYSDPLFLGYMAHQQGSAGISAILWAEKNGLSEVPTNNPYTKSDINRNMRSNFIASDAQKIIGTSELTPANFLKYWALKTAAAKQKTTPQIFPSIDSALVKVANETGVDIDILRAMCRIESAGGCSNESSITTVNSGGYSGLFQLSSAVFNKYKKSGGNILNAYDNALAAALYYKDNLKSVKR